MTSTAPGVRTASPPSQGVDQVVRRLRRTAASGRTRPRRWRAEQLAAIERLLTEQEGAIAEPIAADLGRSAHDSWLGEIAGTKAEAAYARRRLRRWMRPRRVGLSPTMLPGSAHYRFEPLGVVLVIAPWNHPFNLTLRAVRRSARR